MGRDNNTLGAGLLGLGVGLLVGLFISPRSGQENREAVTNWATNMRDELNRRLRYTKDLTQMKYNQMVDQLGDKYRRLQGIKENELDDLVADLKMRWDRIKDEWNSGETI